MATATGSLTLSFPSRAIMSTYLNNHPLLANDAYLKSNGVVERTAEVFANTTKAPKEVQTCIVQILKWIGLSDITFITSLMIIDEAVQDCAAGKVYKND